MKLLVQQQQRQQQAAETTAMVRFCMCSYAEMFLLN